MRRSILVFAMVLAGACVPFAVAQVGQIYEHFKCETELFLPCDYEPECTEAMYGEHCDHCSADLPVSACSGFQLNNICIQIVDSDECGVWWIGRCLDDLVTGEIFCDKDETIDPCQRTTCGSA